MTSNVGVVIPFYYLSDGFEKDIEALQETIDSTRAYAKRIIVVDDGTKLSSILNAELIRHDVNIGKGATIRTGIEHLLSDSQIEFIVEIDADNDQDPKEVYKFIEVFKKRSSDENYLVIGNRYSAPEMRNPGKYREIIKDLQTSLFSKFGFNIRDSVSGFRGYSRSFANVILQKSESRGFGIATEQIILAYLTDTTLEEIPLGYAKLRKHFTKSYKISEVLEGIIIHREELKQRGFQELVESLGGIKNQIDVKDSPVRISLNGDTFEFTYNNESYTLL